MIKVVDDISIDEEFRTLLSPLDEDERRLLEISILCDGVRDALVLWENVLVDGHNRREICQEHNIPFDTVQLDIAAAREAVAKEWPDADVKKMTDRAVVALWIIRNQRCRRNISNYMRGHLANETAKRLKVRPVGKPKKNGNDIVSTLTQLPKGTKRRDAAAQQHGISAGTAHKVAVIDAAVESGAVEPDVVDKLRRGEESVNAVYQKLGRKKKPPVADHADDWVGAVPTIDDDASTQPSPSDDDWDYGVCYLDVHRTVQNWRTRCPDIAELVAIVREIADALEKKHGNGNGSPTTHHN